VPKTAGKADDRRWCLSRPARLRIISTDRNESAGSPAVFSLLLPALLIGGGAVAVIAISADAIWASITAVLIVIGVPLAPDHQGLGIPRLPTARQAQVLRG
jgi:hypothetical protein